MHTSIWEKSQWSTGAICNALQCGNMCGVVMSNTSECINSMIDDYQSEGWTDLMEGILKKWQRR